MKKPTKKKEEVSNNEILKAIGSLGKDLGSRINSLDSRISGLEKYMKQGFTMLDNKIDLVDTRLSNKIEGLGKRIDDLAESKTSKITYKELEKRVVFLESIILSKVK